MAVTECLVLCLNFVAYFNVEFAAKPRAPPPPLVPRAVVTAAAAARPQPPVVPPTPPPKPQQAATTTKAREDQEPKVRTQEPKKKKSKGLVEYEESSEEDDDEDEEEDEDETALAPSFGPQLPKSNGETHEKHLNYKNILDFISISTILTALNVFTHTCSVFREFAITL